jgi:hypothetical protein
VGEGLFALLNGKKMEEVPLAPWGCPWGFTLWLFNIAMANCPFIDGLPIKNDDFPWLC